MCLWVTAASCSCAAHIQPVPPARGRGCQRWLAARGCSGCDGGPHPESRDPGTSPRTTRETLRNLEVWLNGGDRHTLENSTRGNICSFRELLLLTLENLNHIINPKPWLTESLKSVINKKKDLSHWRSFGEKKLPPERKQKYNLPVGVLNSFNSFLVSFWKVGFLR